MVKRLFYIYTLIFLFLATPAFATNYCDDVNAMGCWAMTSNGGNETDLSGEGETLTETGGTIPTSSDTPDSPYPYAGTSRDFELSETEYLLHADGGSTDIIGANQSLSYCFWAKQESAGVDMGIINKYEGNAGKRQYKIRYDTSSDSMIAFMSSDGSTNTSVTATSTDYDDGNWHHVCFVSNDTDLRIYKDGALDCTPVAYTSGLFDGSEPFIIGSSWDLGAPTVHYDGLIDEVIVLDRALSAVEVLEIYNRGIQGNQNRRVL